MSDFKALPNGFYNIRPANGHSGSVAGGMYVTGDGLGKPLILSAQRPPQSQHQKWHVSYNEETKHYLIKLSDRDGSGGYGFSWYGYITPESRVVLGESQEFLISPDPSDANSYLIRPKRDIIGVEICVGVNDQTRELQFKYFPLHAPPEPRPLWRFTRVN